MFARIYSKNNQIQNDIKEIILKNKDYSLKDLLYKYAIPETRIEWKNQKRTFKVIARNDNFIIITRPYNPQRTFEYSILDLEYMECNHDNYYCKYDYSNEKECIEALKEIQDARDEEKKTNISNDSGLKLSRRGIAKIEDVVTGILMKIKVKQI